MLVTVIKQPGESIKARPAFATKAPIATLVDIEAVARGLVPGAAALTFSAELAGGAVLATIGGGSDGERYLVTVRATDAEGATLEGEIDIAVIEASWALPDGGTPHLSIIDFVNRFGLDEVIRMTDTDGSGRIDRQLLVSALGDAQAIADAHLAGRYALPLAVVPPIVKLAEADLARARLYPRGAPDGIEGAAKSALRMLERIQGGQMALGVAAIDAPATVSPTPILISPGRRAYPDNLADY